MIRIGAVVEGREEKSAVENASSTIDPLTQPFVVDSRGEIM